MIIRTVIVNCIMVSIIIIAVDMLLANYHKTIEHFWKLVFCYQLMENKLANNYKLIVGFSQKRLETKEASRLLCLYSLGICR